MVASALSLSCRAVAIDRSSLLLFKIVLGIKMHCHLNEIISDNTTKMEYSIFLIPKKYNMVGIIQNVKFNIQLEVILDFGNVKPLKMFTFHLFPCVGGFFCG